MQAVITQKLTQSLKSGYEPYEVRDQKLKGFLIRIQPSGSASYVVQYKRGKRITLGKVSVLTPTMARERAKTVIGMFADGATDFEIREAIKPGKGDTLKSFIDDHYEPWAVANLKTGSKTIRTIRAKFYESLEHKYLPDISPWLIEKWRKGRKASGRKVATVNRELSALKACLSKAVEWGKLDINPIQKVKLDRVDSNQKVRYLETEEEYRLRKALSDRDAELKAARERGNEWRDERVYDPLPLLSGAYGDHLSPLVLISINTGIRQGELFNLSWDDININKKFLTVVGGGAKSGKTRHIPLNDEAMAVLEHWREQTEGCGYVFPGETGERLNNVKKAWMNLLESADIKNFRWHDMRHHFASRLIMAGVSLYTIKDLLGHASIQMTERYSHLSPDHMAEAVAKLSPPYSNVIKLEK